ncbi:hypothetical protein SAMN02982929_01869 [Saccharopolyspora kobensis]|uniref:Uncharacterized protein n=2 Tax=Saccharopolyspora kobensis TaxID=146035 RepID=A0A1H5ZLF4_9PSEU|nr:hypothetical protein SAMN02982929_01869 [Saccharopolyspora kobensis]SFF20926.1 hypothetical protein SAMN05216506_12226 [Saccharopolyspora kobensis]
MDLSGGAKRLREVARGGYVLSLSTGMTEVGRASSVATRLNEHLKNCENHGVDVAVLSTPGDLLLMERSLKRLVKGHPLARTSPSATESAFDIPFGDIVGFLIRERLGDVWGPTTEINFVLGASSLDAVLTSELAFLRDQAEAPDTADPA